MDEKKLYEVTVEYTFYAYAEDAKRACDLSDVAMQDAFVRDLARAREVKHADHPLAADWDEDCLIYHDDGNDISLGMLLEKLPVKGGK